MKLLLSFLMIWVAAQPLLAKSVEKISFDQISDRIRTQNPVVNAMRDRVAAAQAREGFLKRSFLPEIKAEAATEVFKLGQNEQRDQSFLKVEANVNLYRGRGDEIEEETRKRESASRGLELQKSLQEQLEKAYEIYWTLVFKQNHVQTLNEHLSLSQKNLREANRRIGAGIATPVDRMEFEMKISLIKQESARVESEIRRLARVLGDVLGASQPVEAKDALQHFHDWENNLQPVPAGSVPEVKLMQNQKEVIAAQIKRRSTEALPVIDLYAGYSDPNLREERERESYAGVRATWSLGKTIESRVERAGFLKELRAQETQLGYSVRQAETQQSNQFEELKTLHSFVHDSEENIKISYKYLENSLKEYGRGVKNSLDVLEATEKYVSAKIRFAEIIRDFNLIYSSQWALRQM